MIVSICFQKHEARNGNATKLNFRNLEVKFETKYHPISRFDNGEEYIHALGPSLITIRNPSSRPSCLATSLAV